MKTGMKVLGGTVVAMALLSGCGRSMKDVAGEYTSTLKFEDIMSEEDKSDIEALEQQGMGFLMDTNVTLVLTLDEDGNYKMAPDAEKLMADFKSGLEENGDSVVKAVLTAQNIDESQYESISKTAGYDSFQDFSDYLIGEMMGSLDSAMDGFRDSLKDSEVGGEYTLSGDKITLSNFNADGSDGKGKFDSDDSFSISETGPDSDLTLTFKK
ncbi:MAG: hypothetical protein K6E50_15875 [Lachnospiraceae bacterium]|nr:hypothetical protein [Lachnospiraceae bacterium]